MLFKAKSVVLFALFLAWGVLARRSHPEVHKRMMVLATWALMDAAIARIAGRGWLSQFTGYGLAPYDHAHIFQLLWLAPALLYDCVRRGSPHWAYIVGIALFLPWAVGTHLLWGVPGWLELAPQIMGKGWS